MANVESGSLCSNAEWEKFYPRAEYQARPPSERATKFTLHYLLALNQSDKTVLAFIERNANSDILTAVDLGAKKWTPLTIAVMRGRQAVVEALLQTNAKQQLNHPDVHGWTPLHHAALASEAIYRHLIQAGASKYSLNAMKGTPQDIYSLCHTPARLLPPRTFLAESGKLIPTTELTTEQLSRISLKEWRDAPYYPPQFWKELWQDKPQEKSNEKLWLKAYEGFVRCQPRLIIKEEPGLEGCPTAPMGLFAGQTIHPGMVVTEYIGEYKTESSKTWGLSLRQEDIAKAKDQAYLLNPYDAKDKGNGGRSANFGWPNCAMVSVVDNGCLRAILVALETISEGEPIYWDYGIYSTEVTFGIQRLLGEEKMLRFFEGGFEAVMQKHNALRSAISSKKSQPISRETYYEIMNFGGRLVFPLNCPAALLKLHFKGLVSAKSWHDLLNDPQEGSVFEAWCEEKSHASWAVRSLILRILEMETALSSHPTLRKEVSMWVQANLGNMPLLHIVKGMEIIGQSPSLADNWTDFQNSLKEKLAHYNPGEDPHGPLSLERRVDDFLAYMRKACGSLCRLMMSSNLAKLQNGNPDAKSDGIEFLKLALKKLEAGNEAPYK